jgi:hypothetical protein
MIYCGLDGCSYFLLTKENSIYQKIEMLFLCCNPSYYLEDSHLETVFRKYTRHHMFVLYPLSTTRGPPISIFSHKQNGMTPSSCGGACSACSRAPDGQAEQPTAVLVTAVAEGGRAPARATRVTPGRQEASTRRVSSSSSDLRHCRTSSPAGALPPPPLS